MFSTIKNLAATVVYILLAIGLYHYKPINVVVSPYASKVVAYIGR